MGATGPFFVSIGDQSKLSKFLEVNPAVPAENVFVDDYNLSAYKAAGFSKLEFGRKLPDGYKMTAPEMGGIGGWWKYLKNVASISPSPSADVTSDQVMEAVLRLGGTFIVKGDDVVYQWNDAIPGDTPDLNEIEKVVETSTSSS